MSAGRSTWEMVKSTCLFMQGIEMNKPYYRAAVAYTLRTIKQAIRNPDSLPPYAYVAMWMGGGVSLEGARMQWKAICRESIAREVDGNWRAWGIAYNNDGPAFPCNATGKLIPSIYP